MIPKAESMTEWFKRAGKPSGSGAAANVYLAAFGKHPGWEDHIPGIGVDTEALAGLKQSLYFDGIRGQIDSGAWEKMEPGKRMEGFDHYFLWHRPGVTLLGLMWSSTDRIGRAKYPMILCAQADGFSAGFMLAFARPELESLRDRCKTLNSAEEVTAECRSAQGRLRGVFEREQDGWVDPFSDIAERRRFLDCDQLSPDRTGFLRILHEFAVEQGSPQKAKHLRVPVIAGVKADAFTPWVEFFRSLVPSKIPALFIKRHDTSFLDVIIGEPVSADFFCLQAASGAMPLATQVPYEISAETRSVLERVSSRLGLPAASAKHSWGKTSSAPTATPDGRPPGRGIGRVLMFGIIFVVILAGVALFFFLKTKSASPRAALDTSHKITAATNTAVAAEGAKYGTAIQAATDAFAKGDYDGAIRQANIALAAEPGDAAAMQIERDATTKKNQADALTESYTRAMAAARSALGASHYDEADREARSALAIRPGDSAAMTLEGAIEARRQAATQLRRQQDAAATSRGPENPINHSRAPVAPLANALTTQSGGAAATTLKGNSISGPAAAAKIPRNQSEIGAVLAAWNKDDFNAVIEHANLALQISPDQPDIKSKLRDSVYNELEVYAVWFGVIKPRDATFQLAKTQSPLAQGNIAPSVANAYKNQIDGWLRILKQYHLLDDAHTKLAQTIEENINRY